MLECIRQVHLGNCAHRDIKPENFRVHQGKVCITDFGTILKFIDDESKDFFLVDSQQAFVGTQLYASINAHSYRTLCMRDDLESLGYTILSIYCDNKAFWFNSASNDNNYFKNAKNDFINSSKCDPRLQGIQQYLREVRKLNFPDYPDYNKFSALLQDMNSGLKFFTDELKKKLIMS